MDSQHLNPSNPGDLEIIREKLEKGDAFYGFRQIINKRRLEMAQAQKRAVNQ